jgi:hypothetical protein
MAKRARKRISRLPLPWERRNSPYRALFSGRRFLPIAILAGVGALLLGAYWVGGQRENVRATRATLAEVSEATEAFVRDLGRCPRNVNELVHPPRSGSDYLSEMPTDAWGRGLYVRCEGEHPPRIEVLSAGPSGSFLNDDNVL